MKPIKIILLAIYNKDPFYDEMKRINEYYFEFLNKNSEIMNSVSVFYVTFTPFNISNADFSQHKNKKK